MMVKNEGLIVVGVVFCLLLVLTMMAISTTPRIIEERTETDFEVCIDYCRTKIENEVSAELSCLDKCIDLEFGRINHDRPSCRAIEEFT